MSNERLFICEKPSQARDIARVLQASKRYESYIQGQDVKVTWCLGHLLETAKPDHYCPDLKPWRIEKLPIVPDRWHMVPVNRVKKQLGAVKKLIKCARHIVIATDADREGELIARELLSACRFNGRIERLWLSALDEASIHKALSVIKSGHETEALYEAGLGRQRADWLTGMNMTMATSCLFGKYGEGVLSVGRVQTPTLHLVVKRDRSIEQFKPQDYFELYAEFIDDCGVSIWLKWNISNALQDDEQGRCLNKAAIIKVAAKVHHQVGLINSLRKSKKKQPPPLLFSLSALQKKASSLYGFTAKKTLSIAQALYEKHKATSYPRTDCGYIPVSQFNEAPDVLAALASCDPSLNVIIDVCDTHYKSPAWNDKKVTAHHGIIPTTNKEVNLSIMSSDELKLYKLIRNLYIAQFLGDFVYKHTKIVVVCKDEVFSATGKIPLEAGWKKALEQYKWREEKKGEDETTQDLPNWSEGQKLHEQQEKIAEKKTKPPAHFTEGTLIGAMESIGRYVQDLKLKKILKETSGIGTQATRAEIIETLIKREYIKRDKKKLLSTEKGRGLIDLLPEIVKDPATTARWEQDLEAVAAGRLDLNKFIVDQTNNLTVMLNALKNTEGRSIPSVKNDNSKSSGYPCPSCKKLLIRRKSKAKKAYFWGCSGYPECSLTLPDINGKPGESLKPVRRTDIQCPKCSGGFLIERKGKYGKFLGCSNYPACKNIV